MTSPYYNRYDPAKNYEDWRFSPNRPLQSAELNEIQSNAANRLRGVADVILKDGNVIRDAQIIVNHETGVTQCEAGAVYLRGAVRGVTPATITVPVAGTIAVGLRLQERIVTYVEDPALLDPATESRQYNSQGAERLEVKCVWSWSGDALSGEFFPVYTVTDGIVNAKEPPPQLDGVTQALARYDRDSAGGSYVVSGLAVTRLADREDGYQVFSVSQGRARVNGFGIDVSTSRRLVRNAVPVTRFIDSEPTQSTTAGAQRINVARPPIANITQVRITAEKTVTLTHGTVTGAQDPLPDTSVLSIVSVSQGGTTYVAGTDYKLTAGKVDWSLAGAEPAPGSSYSVTYQYITQVTPTAVDDTGFTVTGAVVGSVVQTSYNTKLPRIDRLCLTEDGAFVWVEGTSTDYNPVRPPIPSNMLPIAQMVQLWTAASYVINDGVRVVPMQDIEAINNRLSTVILMVSEQKLKADAAQRDAAAKKGMFVDPFLGDGQRDQGLAQTAAIKNGELVMAIDATVLRPTADVAVATTCANQSRIALAQERRTGSMKINPYLSFAPLPARSELFPAIDRWTDTNTIWTSPITLRFENGSGNQSSVQTTESITSVQLTRPLEFLRQVDVHFRLSGFGPGEQLQTVTFDGISVTPAAPTITYP